MKLASSTVEVQSNMQFEESTAMGIAPEAVALIVQKLISAYNNPYRAVLREYTSNAYDAHVAAGQTRPVEVLLPDALSPVLKVQDYGIGLDREELKGFGQFGMSSKRDSNEYTGGFGLGSKSGLAVSSQFIVSSVKNGLRNTVIIARDEQNRPHMNFMAEVKTEDPSGTLITVPISDRTLFGDLTDFFVGWKPGSLLVDDEEPKRSVYTSTQFRDVRGLGWYDLSGTVSGRDQMRLMINQVYYILDYKKLGITYNQREILKHYIVKIDNGSVEIHSSREDLIYNAPTKAALEKRLHEILSLSRIDYEKEVKASANLKSALQNLEKMRRLGYPTDGIRFQGRGLATPGQTIQGNRVPDPSGTWLSPSRDASTKSGWRVEKEFRQLSRVEPWQTHFYGKFVIVHGASAPGRYGSGRTAHREAFGGGEWLSSLADDTTTSWSIFITELPINKINRVYRDLADIIVSADEYNAVVSKIRAERAAEAKVKSNEKKAQSLLRVLQQPRSYYNATIRDFTVADIKKDYKKVVFLRNMERGIPGMIRNSLLTKVNHNEKWNSAVMDLATDNKVAIILLAKNDDVTDLLPLLPEVTTFEALAAEVIKGTFGKVSIYERMAKRDRDSRSVYYISSIPDYDLENVVRKETREWLRALRTYNDNGQSTRDRYKFMSASAVVTNALQGMKDSDEPLPPSPVKRYPLVEHFSYGVPSNKIVEYINLVDSQIKRTEKKARVKVDS